MSREQEILYMGDHHSQRFVVINNMIVGQVDLKWGTARDPLLVNGTPIQDYWRDICNQVEGIKAVHGVACSNFTIREEASYDHTSTYLEFLRPLKAEEAAKLAQQREAKKTATELRKQRHEEKQRKQLKMLLNKYPDMKGQG